ncbi:unnamed protein product [Clonostachys rosea f. rosea IK726]|uniref:Zn(2)-C6 fungal-type domain-containing protein n=2 Tax=Bionectria ochroleuca TaxID=29856 RepID=A0A0B7KI64_BIOOC|nr:unnamed protein product [Clonostachys rosea f. rosea IK726]
MATTPLLRRALYPNQKRHNMPSLTRSENVCSGCRSRKKKCDGQRPQCSSCLRRGHPCLYRAVTGVTSWDSFSGPAETSGTLDVAGTNLEDVMSLEPDSFNLWSMPFSTLEPLQDLDLSLAAKEDPASLPPWSVLLELISNFFQKLYAHLPVIHKGRFMHALERDGIDGSSQALLYAICAISAKTHTDPDVRERRYQWYEVAKKLVSESIAGKSKVIESLQAAVLIVQLSSEMMEFCTPWQLLGLAWRKAVLTGCARLDGQARVLPKDLGVLETDSWIEKEECRRTLWTLFIFDRCLCTTDLPRAIDNRHILVNLPMSEDEFQADYEPLDSIPIGFTINVDDLCSRFQRQTLKRKRTVYQYLVAAHHLLGRVGEELYQPNFDYTRDRDTLQSFTSKLVKLRLTIPRHAIELSASDPRDFSLVVWLNAVMACIALLLHHRPLLEGETNERPGDHFENWPHCVAAAHSLANCLRDMCRTSLDFANNTFLLPLVFVCARVLLIEKCVPLSPYCDPAYKSSVKDDLEILAFALRHFKEALGKLGRKYYNGFIYFSRFTDEQCLAAKRGVLLDMLRPCDHWPDYSDEEEVCIS